MTAKSSLLISGSREEAPRAVPPFPCSPGSAVPLRPDGSSRSIRIPARCCVSSAAPSMLPARWREERFKYQECDPARRHLVRIPLALSQRQRRGSGYDAGFIATDRADRPRQRTCHPYVYGRLPCRSGVWTAFRRRSVSRRAYGIDMLRIPVEVCGLQGISSGAD